MANSASPPASGRDPRDDPNADRIRTPKEPEDPGEAGTGSDQPIEIDYTQEEGYPSAYASLEAKLTLLVGKIKAKFQVPKDVVLPVIGVLGCVGMPMVALIRFPDVEKSWPVYVGAAVFGLMIMAGCVWANTKVIKVEKPKKYTKWIKRSK